MCLYPQSDTSFLLPPVLLLQLLPLGILEMKMHKLQGPATNSAVPSDPTLGGLTHPGRQHCLSTGPGTASASRVTYRCHSGLSMKAQLSHTPTYSHM